VRLQLDALQNNDLMPDNGGIRRTDLRLFKTARRWEASTTSSIS
jgi:hypothetical protein